MSDDKGTTPNLHDISSDLANDEAFEMACDLYRMGGGSTISIARAAVDALRRAGVIERGAEE